jgi:hypothetical protein
MQMENTCLRMSAGVFIFGGLANYVLDRQIIVRDAKGNQDRATMLPGALVAPLQEYLVRRKNLYESDLAKGAGYVPLPFALERKYPNAHRE